MMKLVKPSMEYAESFKEALIAFHTEKKEMNIDENDIEGYIESRKKYDIGDVPEGSVQSSMFWLIDNNEFIGRVDVRHRLNEKLKLFGGHIGYAIRPLMRKKGYGTKILELALQEAKNIGLTKVFVTCDDDNIASQKIIEGNGGKLEKKSEWEGKPIRHYWIEIT